MQTSLIFLQDLGFRTLPSTRRKICQLLLFFCVIKQITEMVMKCKTLIYEKIGPFGCNIVFKSFIYFILLSEKELLESLPLRKQCTEEEQVLLHFLFENKLKKVIFKKINVTDNPWLTTCCLMTVQSYQILKRMLYDPYSSSGYYKMLHCPFSPLTWLLSGSLTVCLHL